MRLESSTRLLRNLCSYDRKRNKRPKIRVQYITFGNKSTPHKESGVLRRNHRTTGRAQYSRHRLLMWLGLLLGGAVLAAAVYLYLWR